MEIKNGIFDRNIHILKGLVTIFHHYITYFKKNNMEISRAKLISILEICQDFCRKAIDDTNEAINTNNNHKEEK